MYGFNTQEREWREHVPWVAIDWGKPNELPEETNGVIDGMTGQYQVHTDDACEDWVADAHSMEEAEQIAAKHNAALAKEAGIR